MTSRPHDTTPAVGAIYQRALDRMALDREIRLAGNMARHPELSRRQAVARLVAEEYRVELPVPE